MAYDPVKQTAPFAPPLASKHAHTDPNPFNTSSKQSPTTSIPENIAERMELDEKKASGNTQAHWRDRLVSVDHIVSVRDVKLSSPNYKAKYPRHHDFARYVLPVSEADIIEQDWRGKHAPPSPSDPCDSESSVSSGTTLASPVSTSKESGTKAEVVQPDEQQQFLDKVLEEFRTIKAFTHNPGVPKGELKLLDSDAFDQLESRLSVDDQDTPDSWIPRSGDLRRLTGKHPLNAEPDLLKLYEGGMITPVKLHFVRNHAAVPQLQWETHTVSVYSDPPDLMAKPRIWSMDELTSGEFVAFEIPVTLGCDGNRRREVNLVKRTVGFNWTASGVSTARWRGIPVCDVLRACGLREPPTEERWYLHFEGADLPSSGRYATSIPLSHAMDSTNDVMLAFGMNGRVLHPDHGYPLRVIIPGYVGGRQIKWLSEIWVSKEPNKSHYHIWDNKVVPSFIDSKSHPLAKAYFEDESTACWEQTLQSIICKPAHEEVIQIQNESDMEGMYTVRGFAFNGGGDRIERVELSLDGGKTWRWCFRHFLDAPLRHGTKYWAWLFWSCDVKLKELVNAFEIIVRAQDNKKMYQPEHITWTLTGMMNNSWYRVRPNVINRDPETSRCVVRFQHPVAPLDEEGGWMVPSEAPRLENHDNPAHVLPTFSLEEVAKHDKMDDAWVILDNKVYDVTSILSWHPGGPRSILMYAGKASIAPSVELTALVPALLTIDLALTVAHGKRDECLKGVLSAEAIKVMEGDAARAAKELHELLEARKGLTLQPDAFTAVRFVKRADISNDSRLYTFELPRQSDGSPGRLGLPVGQHVQISLHFKDQAVQRSYTPIRPVLPAEEDGTFDLLVKTYLPAEGEAFSPGGEEIDIRGPSGGICYLGRGDFKIQDTIFHFDKINLIAGGSGLTPHWQLIHAILSDPEDKTLISLLDSNKTYDDIWMRNTLQQYSQEHSTSFKLWHVLTSPPEGWQYSSGKVRKTILEERLYPYGTAVATFVCGPEGMIDEVVLPALKDMGFEEGISAFVF
ncbi:Nitrate reductase [NADH] 1 [Trametes pubescens]|uniref:Nitrate reductase [NADPH] n=1 Tax=Trametes pubescens TaxID=154538 RepID=A0A1M2VXS6_TRAPU|nr:Nitrate reductase [NADH] 1 [Trametes pubescens]